MAAVGDDQVDELKEEIQGLEEELERLNREKQSDTGSSRSVEAIEDEIREVQEQVEDVVESPGWSRRDFLKAVGGGAAGLGAAAMLPSLGSAFKVESDNALKYFNQSGLGKSSFSVTPGGNVTAPQLGEPNDKIQNIHASSVTTNQLNDVHYIATSDNPQTVIDNNGGNTTYVFLPGTHTLTGSFPIQVTDNDVVIHLLPGAELKHGDSEATSSGASPQFTGSAVIRIGDGGTTTVNRVAIKGEGIINGNRGNQTNDSTGILFDEDCHDCDVYDVEIKEMAGQGINSNGDSVRNSNIGIHGVHVHDCDKDGIIGFKTDGWTCDGDFLVDTIADQDGVEPSGCTDVRIVNGKIRNTKGGNIDVFAGSDSVIIDNVTFVDDAGTAVAAITIGANNNSDNNTNVQISDCTQEVATGSSNTRFIRVGTGTASDANHEVTVTDCESDGGGTAPIDVLMGDVTIRGFVGRNLQNAINIDTSEVRLIDCELDRQLVLTANANDTVVRGGEYTTSAGKAIDATNGPDTITIDGVTLRGGGGSEHIQIEGGDGPHRIKNIDSVDAPDHGMLIKNTTFIIENCTVETPQNISSGIRVAVTDGSTYNNCRIAGCDIIDATDHSIHINVSGGGDFDHLTVTGNNVRGATNANIDDQSTGSNNIIKDNQGYATEARVLSGTFAIDSTGAKTKSIAHGLDVTPAVEDCSLTIIEDSDVDDWDAMPKVTGTDGTNVDVVLDVTSASGTTDATCKLSVNIRAGG